MSIIQCPLSLDATFQQTYLHTDIVLKKLSEKQALKLLGLKVRKISSNGFITSYGLAKPQPILMGLDHLRYMNILTSNYVLVDRSGKSSHLDAADTAIRLISLGRSGLMMGYIDNNGSQATQHYFPSPYWKKIPLTKVGRSDLKLLKGIFKTICNSKDPKVKLVVDRYKNAIAFDPFPNENRFVDLTTILEMLFLPQGGTAELKYRLCLRIAKVFQREFSMDIENIFGDAKKIYDVRSKIVHTGHSKDMNEELLIKLCEYARLSILLFIQDPTIFSDLNLEKSCLE